MSIKRRTFPPRLLKGIILVVFTFSYCISPISATASAASVIPCDPNDPNRRQKRVFRSDNDILYFDDCEQVCEPGNNNISNIQGSDNAEKIWNFLKSKGFSDEQVAGIMGNLAYESGGDPTFLKATSTVELQRIGGGVGGFGLAQWTDDRRVKITNTAIVEGRNLTDLDFQLDYLYQEVQTRTERDGGSKTEEQGIKELKTVEEVTEYFNYNYERPNSLVANVPKRVEFARGFLAKYGTGDSTVSSGASSSPGSSACSEYDLGAVCGDGGLIGTLKCYAWPDYRSSDVTPTADYQKAIDITRADGRYVGGTIYPGIDCGGFVTILLRDSGFEPGYNYSGRGGNTVYQYEWAQANMQVLGQGNEIDVADLQPGDVANDRSTHTFMWVGPVDGFEPTNIASASLDERAPMAGRENPTEARWTWFRKK